jgi:hypothetical protein
MSPTEVVHVDGGDRHCVAISQLRVLVSRDGEGWIAQGVEIDYAAGGDSVEDVQRRFERGLKATIHRHIERFGTVQRLLKHSPPEEWAELAGQGAAEYEFDVIDVHDLAEASLPYQQVAYITLEELHAA